jgi:hypothetical protein
MTPSRFVLFIALMSAPAFAPAFAQQAPRTSFGAPSLEGLWTNMTATPLERPAAFDTLTTTPERAAAFGKSSREAFLADDSDGIGGRQSEYWEVGTQMLRINGEIRTSIIVDPANGKMPYNAEGKARLAKSQNAMLNIYDDPEARPGPERCLLGGSGSTGAPMFTARYHGHYQFVQTPTHLVIAAEQNGLRRIIPLRPEPKAGPRTWAGNSTGHWEGDTLVVETSGFMPGEAFKPASTVYVSEDAKVTERFTRISASEILYQFTVDDPTAFTQTWRGETLFHTASDRAYETACHEGNYSLPGILSGGRAIERRKTKHK